MTSTPKPRTSGGTALTVLTDEELGSAAQRDRRKRILDATIALAAKGGFEAVQMRAVAEKAVHEDDGDRVPRGRVELEVGDQPAERHRQRRRAHRRHLPADRLPVDVPESEHGDRESKGRAATVLPAPSRVAAAPV